MRCHIKPAAKVLSWVNGQLGTMGKKAVEPITYIGLNFGPKVGAQDFMVGVRVVPDGSNGNEVYGRTLGPGEPDSGEGITVRAGETLVFRPGSVRVRLRDVDRYADTEPDGYAPIANTVWTWLQLPPKRDEAFIRYMLAASRRLDAAHSLCVGALHVLGDREESSIKARARLFGALGSVETMCIALNRAFGMIHEARSKFSVASPVPSEVDALREAVRAIRDAFEHIDERSLGDARRETSVEAVSIFDQTDLLISGTVRYAGYSLNMRAQVIPALIAARQYIYDAVAEAGNTKRPNAPFTFGPFRQD